MHDLEDLGYYSNIGLGKKHIKGRFVIPSGIRCSHAPAIERYFDIESVGIITTKSISLVPKKGYKEPLYAKYGENSYLNAVGLENPGAEIFREELAKIEVPENKFLLVSIFGGNEDDFYKTAELLADYADGFELNMSCPHAKGYGLQIGSDKDLVARITKKISVGFDVPVFVKLSAAIPEVAQTAKKAVESGARGITVTNSIGPGLDYVSGTPVLSNIFGGISGDAIRPLGIKAAFDIRKAIGGDPTIIGMGGISSREHVESYNTAGADFFGIGSALTNLKSDDVKAFLNNLQDAVSGRERSSGIYKLKPVSNMNYNECHIVENISLTDKLHKITLSEWDDYKNIDNVSGKFFFIMIPEIGEKPFALFSYEKREVIVKNVGCFTGELTGMKKGDKLFIRGPYGSPPTAYAGRVINFIAGGTGISPVYEIAKQYKLSNTVRFFFGGKGSGDIFDIERFEGLGDVYIATEDGSIGDTGYVSDILGRCEFGKNEANVFVNVGPKPMIENCYEIERTIADEYDIWASIEYRTSCGVGICGKCATEKGFLSCVDGPFLRIADALKLP